MLTDLTDKQTVSELQDELNAVAERYPLVMSFLEDFCGFYKPGFSADPQEIAYAAGKRDVILTVKSLMRRDILPETIANFYERNL